MFTREGPLLVVASGRDTISVSSSIRRLTPDSVFVVQVKIDCIGSINSVHCHNLCEKHTSAASHCH